MPDEPSRVSRTSEAESLAVWIPTLGAWREAGGTRFRIWAPEHTSVELVLETSDAESEANDMRSRAGGTMDHVGSAYGLIRTDDQQTRLPYIGQAIGSVMVSSGDEPTRVRDVRPLARDDHGYWSARFGDIGPGALYRYRLNGRDDQTFPDPASRFQPYGVHGPSQVVEPASFRWTDQEWRPPPREALVLYELHIGTFSPTGTFRGAMERLPYLAQLGVTALELMPLGDFPGERNWGYDGVALFAPARCYGAPDDLRGFVDAAHQHGLAVFLDVVYNHLGPDGAYANAFSPYYFTDRHSSPWGKGVDLDGPYSGAVRGFFIENALHWVHEYHIDGLRLDATHAMQDDGPTHFLAELTAKVHERSPRPIVIAEDHRNLDRLLLDRHHGGWGLDGVWADDFHHQIRVHVAGDRDAYYRDFAGSADDIATTIRQGWFFTGQHSAHLGEVRGTDPHGLDPRQFVICVQNHDQIGNRADGARLNHQIDVAVFRAVTTLLLAAPETPLLFMGQEWAANTPFLFFTDHHDELGRQITKGRREEFAAFEAFGDPRLRERIPDPQDRRTFEASRLQWDEMNREPHASMVRLYQRLLGVRATAAPLRESGRDTFEACALDAETIRLTREADVSGGAVARHREQLLIIARLEGEGTVVVPDAGSRDWQVLLTTEDSDLAPDPMPIEISTRDGITVRFARPGAVVLRGPAFAT
jgi:maltooligosyltrehalose trehalohydrolase